MTVVKSHHVSTYISKGERHVFVHVFPSKTLAVQHFVEKVFCTRFVTKKSRRPLISNTNSYVLVARVKVYGVII